MHLEEVILDGFKSYAQHTRVQPFDRSFTAITKLKFIFQIYYDFSLICLLLYYYFILFVIILLHNSPNNQINVR
jgi:hypothetical protein